MSETTTLEKKVYPSWASSRDYLKKRDINLEIYAEPLKKYKVSRSGKTYDLETQRFVPINPDDFDVVIEPLGCGYATSKYHVVKNAPSLSLDELALICDDGNLCFGYRGSESRIVIYTD